MPEQHLYVNHGTIPVADLALNPDDKLTTERDDDGNWHVNIEGAVVTGDVHEVAIGPGAAGGVAKVWPPMTEAHAVMESKKSPPKGASAPASAKDRKAAAGDALPADENEDGTPASRTAGQTPPESGGKAGTGFSGQVAP